MMAWEHKVFMSYKGKKIWYTETDEGDIAYSVARGDGTDEYFTDWQMAMKWIDSKKAK